MDFEPGASPDRLDFEWEPPEGGYTGLFGDGTRKGRSAFGQVFIGLEDACGETSCRASPRRSNGCRGRCGRIRHSPATSSRVGGLHFTARSEIHSGWIV